MIGRKILVLMLILFGIVIVAELGYYFFYQPDGKTRQATPSRLDPTISSGPNTASSLLRLIPEEKRDWSNSINALSYFKQPPIGEGCTLTPGCINLDNTAGNGWWTEATTSALLLDRPFAIKISLQNKNDLAGISLAGRINQSQPWWENVTQLFIGVGSGGSRLYVDAKDGTSEKSHVLLDQQLSKNVSTFYVFMDQQGKSIIIADESYNPLANIDVNKTTQNKFTQGLFPDRKFYVGYSVGPYSYLSILDFFILNL